MSYNRRPLQNLNVSAENSKPLTQSKNQKEVFSSTKVKKSIPSWLLQKQSRFNDLYDTASHIWRREGSSALIERLYKFIKGERRYSKLPVTQDFNMEYSRWIQVNEPSLQMLDQQRQQEKRKFAYRPLISILTPVYNTDQTMLEEMIGSVLAQTYSNWELVLVDGGSSKCYIRSTLNEYAQQDSRIKVKHLDSNYGISGNSNEGLKMLTGEFIALLDHDDLLSADALFEVVSELNNNLSLDFIYSDKDTITEDGGLRFNPLFKPEWSPDILFNANYLTHLNVIRTQLLHDVGGFDPKTDGAQDWDLFLRITARTNRISHVPRILYHWRYHEESTASGMHSKPYASQGQLQSIEKHLGHKNLEAAAQVELGEYTMPKVVWAAKADLEVTIIIDLNKPTINLLQLIKSCLSQSMYSKIEIIILNRSGSRLTLSDAEYEVKIFDFEPKTPVGIAYQTAISATTGEIILFLNADLNARNIESVIHELVGWTQFEEIGAVGGMLLRPDGAVASTGLIFSEANNPIAFGYGLQMSEATLMGHLVWYRNFSAIPVDCMAVRRKVIDEVNGFDIELDRGCYIDLCLKLSALGYRHLYTPYAVLKFQFNNSLANGNLLPEEIEVLHTRHKTFFEETDPYSNTHLNFDKGITVLKN